MSFEYTDRYQALGIPYPDPGLEDVRFTIEKPAAMVTIDDRALTFDGTWPDIATLKAFQPWNKRQRATA